MILIIPIVHHPRSFVNPRLRLAANKGLAFPRALCYNVPDNRMDCSKPSSPKTKLWAEDAASGAFTAALCRFLFCQFFCQASASGTMPRD
ncbi:MAG: hypothetical protein ACI4PG_09715 [Candidatus Ventricola sp.]